MDIFPSRLSPSSLPFPPACPGHVPIASHASHGERLHGSTPCRRLPLAASPFACLLGAGARAALSSSPPLR